MKSHQLTIILEEYQTFVNARSVENFAAATSEILDNSWRDFFLKSTIEDVIEFVVSDSSVDNVPESLKSLRNRLKSLEYNRKCVRNPSELWEKWTGTKRKNGLDMEFKIITSSNGVIRKRIKAKKQHEIDRIVELISQIKIFSKEESVEIESLVDIGAGVGHLSRMISLQNGLKVMAVEGNQQFTLAANSLDEKLIQESAKIGNSVEFNTSPLRFTSFVTEDLAVKIDDFAGNSGTILVGLHCCGDFSSTILKVFRKSKKAKALVLLGCCYHKQFQCFHFLNPTNEIKENNVSDLPSTVFPLSQKWAGCDLSYILRESACHSNENLRQRFDKQKIDISRYARAHLEKWIWEVSDDPEDRNIGMCSVKCTNDTTFEEYIRKAMEKRGIHLMSRVLEKIPDSLLSSCVSSLPRSLFDQCDVIRLMFAPAIESAILDDRLEFLRENGIEARVVPLFEPSISPRNLAIVAYKH